MSELSTQSTLPVVAIAGATGHLGHNMTKAFLAPRVRSRFSKVILLSRQPVSASVHLARWQDEGNAMIRSYDEDNFGPAIADVDIFVNAIGASGHSVKDKMLRALPDSKVATYFPSEFGVDHYIHDFPHPEWDRKKHHFNLAKGVIPQVKLCRVFIGLFTEDSIGPWFGFDTRDGRYESVGSAESPVSFTSLEDTGKVVAKLATMPSKKIPDQVHIGGDTVSMREIASEMETAGAGDIDVTEIDLAGYKEEVLKEKTDDPSKFLRFLMGERKIDHTVDRLGNDNELVNPGESEWRWKKMADLASETDGRPWADLAWPPNSS